MMNENLLDQYLKKNSEYYEGTRPEIQELVPADCRRLLDIGCAYGGFGAELSSKRTIEVWGVELNPVAAATAEKCLQKVYTGAFNESLNLPEGYFDTITFNDVLEHMPDPGSTLRFAKKLLSPRGVVVASVPNFRYFPNMWELCVKKSARYHQAGIMDKTHLRIFTRSSIPHIFEEAGLKVTHLAGINGRWPGRKFFILNALTMGWIKDMRWLQFAVVAGK
jgi:2-polyprenyl-3-methyl-5-hydroxy-6-metoxy-1,4-benzoquinol methylase